MHVTHYLRNDGYKCVYGATSEREKRGWKWLGPVGTIQQCVPVKSKILNFAKISPRVVILGVEFENYRFFIIVANSFIS